MSLRISPAEAAAVKSFSLPEARNIVRDMFAPKAWIFWTDFLTSFCIGTVCFALTRKQVFLSWQQVGLFFVACLLFYRSVLFIHELVHLRTGTFKVFRFVWNLLCGIPMLLPSFLYYTHLDHHARNHYGTDLDGEYIPLASQSRLSIILYLLQSFILAPLAIFRFMVLTPLTWISPAIRNLVYRHMSSMIMDPTYVRPMPTTKVLRIWRIQEIGCFLWCWAIAVMLYRGLDPNVTQAQFDRPVLNGVMPLGFLLQVYLTSVVILLINSVRTLGAHRFLNEGGEVTFSEQLLDSVNYTHWPLISALWAPVGIRYHGLHHLFAAMPYHNLAKAHARLVRELPADSLYHRTCSNSLWRTLHELWAAAKSAEQNRKSQASGEGQRAAA